MDITERRLSRLRNVVTFNADRFLVPLVILAALVLATLVIRYFTGQPIGYRSFF